MTTTPLSIDQVKLGTVGRDRVTGFQGTITAKFERLAGDHQLLLEGMDSTERPIEHWTALARVDVLKA